MSHSLPSTAAATQLARRKTGSRRWRSSSLITVAVCFVFFSQTCSRHFLFWCVWTPQRTTQARSEVKFDAKKTKQNVLHYAKLECRSRTEKVLSYVKFTLEGEKKTQGNQRSHILYNPSLRFSHRCARAALEANASCDVTKGSFSGPHSPTQHTLLDSCPLPNMCNKVQQVAAFTESCKQRAKYAVFQRSIELQAKGNDNNNDNNHKDHGT